ncbi:MAG: hypothetical protein AAGI01_10860 [Myxococcota bacterium]
MPKLFMSAVFLLAVAAIQSGCAGQCAQVSSGYSKALAAERGLLDGDFQDAQDLPTHMGVGLRMDALDDLAKKFLGRTMADGMNIASSVPIGAGKSIAFTAKGQALDLGFEPDDACSQCFRLVGDLGGTLSLNLPLVGKQTIPLNGDVKLVAPIVMETRDDGGVKVVLDLPKFVDYADSLIRIGALKLPEAQAQALGQALSKVMKERLAERLKRVDLFSFLPPDLGIKGLRVLPSKISFDASQRAIFVGFTTNLPGIAEGQGVESALAMSFNGDENVAVALQPAMVQNAVQLLLKEGKIPRNYTPTGQASETGSTRVTFGGIALSSPQQSGASPLSLGFQAWNVGEAACFWLDAVVKGAVTLADSKLAVDLHAVELKDASVAPSLVKALADWKSAAFVTETKRLLERTLSAPRFDVPGGTVTLTPSSLGQGQNSLVLRSAVSFSLN